MTRTVSKLVLIIGVLLAPASRAAQRRPIPSPPRVPATAGAPSDLDDPASTYSLENDREPLALLDRQWRFQPGDNPRWASPDFDDSEWALVGAGADWEETGYRHLDGPAWYRFRVTLPAGHQAFSLRLPVIYTSYQVFADGKLLLTQGQLPPHAAPFRSRPLVVDLPNSERDEPTTMTIALRIWHDPTWSLFRHGGLQGPAEIGRSDLIHSQFATAEQAHLWQYSDELDLGGLELLAFGVALVLYLTRRSEREFLWFGLLTLGRAVGHFAVAWGQLHANGVVVNNLITDLCWTAFLAGSLLFFRCLFHGKWGHAFTFALVCCGLGFFAYPLSVMGALSVAAEQFLQLLSLLPVYLWILTFIARQSFRGQADARILRGPVAFLLLSSVYSQLIWVLQTTGLTFFSKFELRWRTPIFLTLDDFAECAFLLAMLIILLRRFARRSREQDRVESELEAARSVQQVLVPETLPRLPGLMVNTAYHPAQELGGDFFQILPLPSGSTLIVIGDVAGKGLPAALQVSLVVGTLRTLAEMTESPANILAGLNRSLQGRGSGFTTCLALSISPDRTVLTFANAGHIAPFVNGFELRTEPNLPLGLMPECVFEEVRYALNPGDHLTVLTDGVPEAMNHRELFGFERTGQVSRQPAAMIADTARTFGQTDDITVLTIDVLAAPAKEPERLEPVLQPV
jgi:serine phosphatase RsbU (regulator of sigma subunit)